MFAGNITLFWSVRFMSREVMVHTIWPVCLLLHLACGNDNRSDLPLLPLNLLINVALAGITPPGKYAPVVWQRICGRHYLDALITYGVEQNKGS